MWTAIEYVGFVLTPAALLSSLVLEVIYKKRLLKRELLVRGATGDRRAEVVERILSLLKVDAGSLTPEQQYDEVLKRVSAKAKRFKRITYALLAVGIAAAALTAVAMLKVNPKNLAGEVERVELITVQDGSVQLFIRLSVTNTGPPTSVGKYAVRISHATSKSLEYNGPLEEIKGDYVIPQADGKPELFIGQQDSIKTGQLVGKGQKVSGWLKLTLPLPGDVLRRTGTRYTVSFADAKGDTYKADYEVR